VADGDLLHAFCARRDEAAFTALVARHGPLVLAVCARLLPNVEDREDAFQATFLALARDAGSVRQRASVAGWLHGVARHIALDVRRASVRRHKHEAQAVAPIVTNPAWEAAWHEVQRLLDEEIQKLPAKYREPFLLCCLENLGRAEAATRLGLKEGTVRSRLSEARRRLRARLARRGVDLSAVLATGAVADTVSAHVPMALAAAVTRSAVGFGAANTIAAGLVSARVATLIQGVPPMVSGMKTTSLWLMVLALSLLSTGLGAVAYRQFDNGAADAESAVQEADAAPGPAEKPNVAGKISGRVIRDEDGRPVAGADVQMIRDIGSYSRLAIASSRHCEREPTTKASSPSTR
jgi:RNA polymerase sigma factor (sigma-70 family)